MRTLRLVCAVGVAALVIGLVGMGAGASPLHSDRLLWAMRYDGPAHGDDAAAGMAVSADSSVVYVTSTSWAGAVRRDDIVTVAYGREGGKRWVRAYNGTGSVEDTAGAVAAGRARVYVTGTTVGRRGTDYVTIAYTSGGDRLWAHRFDSPTRSEDAAADIDVSPDGSTVFVTGSSATIAYRSDGSLLWTAPTTPGDYLAVSADGSKLFVAWGAEQASDFLTVGIDAVTGTESWRDRFEPGGGPYVFGITASPDGRRVYVGGGSSSEMGESWTDLVAYRTDGTRLWSREYWPDAVWGNCLAARSDGERIYLAGEGAGGLFVIAYDPRGRLKFGSSPWFDGMSEWGTLSDMAPGPEDDVYIVGSTNQYEGGDIATFAFGPSGAQRWGVPYDGPGHRADRGKSIVVSPDGTRVFVTGDSGGMGTAWDISTVAYRTG